MTRRVAQLAAFALTLFLLPTLAQGTAHAKNCGGQKALPQPVPYTCTLPGHTIDGTHFTAVVVVTGTVVVATISLDAPRTVPTPTVIRHHVGKSGDGGAVDSAAGIIPPGQVSIRLQDSVPCREGQADIKAVYVAPGDARGLIGGPWIQNGTGCNTPVTPPATQPPVTQPPAPPVTPATPVTPGKPAGPPVKPPTVKTPAGPAGPTLPATGKSKSPALGWGLLGLTAGCGLLIVAYWPQLRRWRLARQR